MEIYHVHSKLTSISGRRHLCTHHLYMNITDSGRGPMPPKDNTPNTLQNSDLYTILPQVMMDNEHLIVFCTDDTGNILIWNRAAESITGYSQEEIPDLKTAFQLLYPDITYRTMIENVRSTFRATRNRSKSSETRIRTKNGHIRHISWNTQQISQKEDPSQLFITLGTDVTHARHTERDALLLGEIVTSSHDAICGISTDGIILTWNTAAETIFGYREMESIGEPFLRQIPEEHKTIFSSVFRDVSKGNDFSGNMECHTKSGRTITVNVTFSPILGEDGTVDGISAIMRDITRDLSLQQTMKGYISEATLRLNHPAELVEGNLAALIERIENEDIDNEDISTELEVQKKALSQIVHNLRELSQAIIGHFKDMEDDTAADMIR